MEEFLEGNGMASFAAVQALCTISKLLLDWGRMLGPEKQGTMDISAILIMHSSEGYADLQVGILAVCIHAISSWSSP